MRGLKVVRWFIYKLVCADFLFCALVYGLVNVNFTFCVDFDVCYLFYSPTSRPWVGRLVRNVVVF